MKWIQKITTLLLLLGLSYSSFGQSGFEGKIVMQTENNANGEQATVSWYIKGKKQVMEFDSKTGEYEQLYTILIEKEQAILITEKDGKKEKMAINQYMNKPNDFPNSYEMVKKEVNMISAQFSCTRYTLEYDKGTIELWLTNDVSLSSADFPQVMQNGYLKIANELEPGAFPVKIIAKHKNGNLNFSQKVIAVSEEELGEDLFDLE